MLAEAAARMQEQFMVRDVSWHFGGKVGTEGTEADGTSSNVSITCPGRANESFGHTRVGGRREELT